MDDYFLIGQRKFTSRLIIGSGKYKSFQETKNALDVSGAQMITVAIARTNIGQDSKKENLLDYIDKDIYTILPNTAGCFNADEAVRVAMIARELLETNLLKLEVLLDKKSLLPNESEPLKAAEKLVKENFSVMVYTTQNILLAKDLENIGCDAIMPLGSQIGTGQGIKTPDNIRKIIEKANVPVIVDAGIRTPSDASLAMEMGCEAVLLNTSIAESKNTSLAVVAPGIAEALFATALGLLAAIPAVAAYNKFSGDMDKIGTSLDVFAQEFTTLLGRQLDEGGQ